MGVDLTGADVVDAHCHPFRSQDLLDREPRTFETRCMFMGTALLSSNHAHHESAAWVEELTETTMFGLALRRWLAGELRPPSGPAAIQLARALVRSTLAYARERVGRGVPGSSGGRGG